MGEIESPSLVLVINDTKLLMPCKLGIATHVMKVHGGMGRWSHDHKEMKHEVEIMVIDEE